MRLNTIIKLGELLGRAMSSKDDLSDRRLLSKWFNADSKAPDTIRKILDSESIAQRRKLYDECDSHAAWNRVRASANGGRNARRAELRPFLMAVGSVAAAVALVGGFVFVDRADDDQREKTMIRIAQIQPDGSKAVLYRADGTFVEFSADNDSTKTIDGLDIGNNAIEYKKVKRVPQKEIFDELVTPRGGEFKLTLVDGTRVWLNADSRLRYFATNTSSVRKVFLTGEAYFEVAHDSKRPFVVESGGQQIKVLGTRFNVSAYPDQHEIKTTLVDGSVQLNDMTRADSVYLAPGQQSVFDVDGESHFDVNYVNTDRYTAWTSGVFVFEHASLHEIMNRLSRWYVFDFEIANRLSNLHFSGEFPRYENLDKVLEVIISTGYNIKIELHDKTIILK